MESGKGNPSTRRRICLATPDIVGPVRNGGIGTAFYWLARLLAREGHDVTLLYTLGSYCENESIDHWRRVYRGHGIDFVPLTEDGAPRLEGGPHVVRSYLAYEYVKQRDFDVVHFPEWQGHGFYTAKAKRMGLLPAGTIVCVQSHSPTRWHLEGSGEALRGAEDLELDHLERGSVEAADVLVSPSRYLVEWLRERQYRLPDDVQVRQNVIGGEPAPRAAASQEVRPVRELVFFGRLEVRKGIQVFCDAMEDLCQERRDFSVAFLGKRARVGGADSVEYVTARSGSWGVPVHFVTDRDHAGAMEYLSHPGRMAVIPSLMENLPYTVLECLVGGIPLLASEVGGIPELVAPEDRARTLFRPTRAGLGARLREALARGAAPSRPAVEPRASERQWLEWHAAPAKAPPAPRGGAPQPRVTVCLVHYDRPRFLEQAVQSLEGLDYPNFDVVLVDDGSKTDEARRFLDQLAPRFGARGWKLVRQENRYLGAARNEAARHATGEYLLFMDDDNLAKPDELTRFVACARASGADVLTCVVDKFRGDKPPAPGAAPRKRWLPLGGALGVGFFRNCFGDANALFRREAFEAVGGFTEDYGVGFEDWELFAKLCLRGYRVEAVPEPLFWYRTGGERMTNRTQTTLNYRRALRPYFAGPQHWNDDLLASLQGLCLQGQCPGAHQGLGRRRRWLSRTWTRWKRSMSKRVARLRSGSK